MREVLLSRLCRESPLTPGRSLHTLGQLVGMAFHPHRLPHGECGVWGSAPGRTVSRAVLIRIRRHPFHGALRTTNGRAVTNAKLLSKMLRLKALKITDFQFKQRDKELHLALKPYKNGCRCPHCERRGRIVHQGNEARVWEDVAILGMRILFHYAPKEIECPTHGRFQEEIPWAAASSRA